jgi:four helix bundle protein
MLSLSHKKPDVYQIAMNMVKEVYKATASFPKEEKYTLISQIRRAVVSVCSNIAEGASRFSKKEKKRFYEISRSSLVEMDTHFELEQYIESTFRMLSKMINNLGADPTNP